MAAHDRLLGEAAHSEGQPLEAVAELGAHDVVQDGVDGLQMRKGTSLFCSVFSHDMTATHHIYLLLVLYTSCYVNEVFRCGTGRTHVHCKSVNYGVSLRITADQIAKM